MLIIMHVGLQAVVVVVVVAWLLENGDGVAYVVVTLVVSQVSTYIQHVPMKPN